MLKKRFIVVSRKYGRETSIQALPDPFDGNLTFAEIGDATEAIERDLVKRGMQARAAARFAYGVAGCRIAVVHHASDAPDMYYRILVADFTSNRVPITPGLRVRDYDQRKGVVVAAQFMATSSLAPGGNYFDGRYYVEANQSPRVYIGSKLVAL